MEGLVNFLKDIYNNCSIEFSVYMDDKMVYETNPNINQNKEAERIFFIGKNKLCIKVNENHEELLKIIEFCIKNKFKENYNHNEKIIIELLKNALVDKEKIKELPFDDSSMYFICISVSQKLEDVIEVLKNIYSDTQCIIIKYDENILLIGQFEDIRDHVYSISDTISSSIYEKSYISYCKIKNYEDLNKIYKECRKKIIIGKKYRINENIYDEDDLIFEKILDDITAQTKEDISNKFVKVFSQMDEDMINTIETFFKRDLNLSEAAKQLYVHRNTLIYRIDKIQKYTGYDIRKFNDACIFKIAFSLYIQQKTNK